jgi:hypothetical protein
VKYKRQLTTRSKRDPLELLVESLLTLDWEISDENIQKFEGALKAVKRKCTGDRYSKRLIDKTLPVCSYLRVRKESSSPASVQFLHSATRILLDFWREKIKARERKQVLERLLVKFRALMADVLKLEETAALGAKKTPARMAKKPTATAEVLKAVMSRKMGVDVATLKQLTGFTDSQIRNILYRAGKQGKIHRISRGVYISA